MKHWLYFVVIHLCLHGQAQELKWLSGLDETISESSGLLYLQGRIITHNDSGGTAALYEITTGGTITRTVTITNATAVDWEAITADDTHIYIGDFGNNSGARTDLKIYKIAIADYLNTTDDTVVAERIHYSYADQTDFTPRPLATNFDAEALVTYQDQLYIFTKNWIDQKTTIYSLSKIPGTYAISKMDALEVQGLITDASFNPVSGSLVLTGYTFISPFIVTLRDFSPPLFSNGVLERYPLQMPLGKSSQVEGITFFSPNHYYLTSEESFTGDSGLYSLTTEDLTLGLINDTALEAVVFPNPLRDHLYIQNPEMRIAAIYDLKGALQKSSTEPHIDVSDLDSGVYCIRIQGRKNTLPVMKKIVIH